MTRPHVVIAGGGTGGHVYPGLAVADALRALADVDVTFVGTERGLETRAVPARGYPLELLHVVPMKGGGPARAISSGFTASAASLRAAALLRKLRPRVVLSVGGYAAGPLCLAASLLRVPLAILEPNAVLGLTNKLLAPLAQRAYLAWPVTSPLLRARARRIVGVPLRGEFTPSPYRAGASARLLVLGGSQGAKALNERLPLAVAKAEKKLPALEVLHQAGRERDDEVRAAYAREGAKNVTVVPFIDDVAHEIARADLLVARAGAGTLAEVTAVGRASILVPFPFAADDHQAVNAKALADAGGAVAIRQEAADDVRLASEITALFADAAARVRMAEAARAVGRPMAARAIAEDLLHLAHIDARPSPPPIKGNGRGPVTPFSEVR